MTHEAINKSKSQKCLVGRQCLKAFPMATGSTYHSCAIACVPKTALLPPWASVTSVAQCTAPSFPAGALEDGNMCDDEVVLSKHYYLCSEGSSATQASMTELFSIARKNVILHTEDILNVMRN